MITITINGNEHQVEEGARLVNAIEDAGYDISHKCGGKAQCTTCRVSFQVGTSAPPTLTDAELAILNKNELIGSGVRLSCQMAAKPGLSVIVEMPVSEAEWDEAGPRPADQIEP